MAHQDPRGNPCASGSAAAREAAERALWRMMSFYDVPLADLDTAIAADPGWALPHLMKAGFLLSLTEPALVPEAAAHLAAARDRTEHATPRERAHLEAVQQVLEGRWHNACRTWDELLVEHPRDALALQWAQLWDFYRGDAAGLRGRPARALPEWDEGDPLYAHVLALYAFGLEECNLQPQAEEAGRRALAIEPRAPWAVHAVAHVMEMQGRFEEGGAWLRQHQGVWSEGNGRGAPVVAQGALQGKRWTSPACCASSTATPAALALQITLQRVDAAAMLWRLHLLGEDVSERCAALLQGWDLGEHGGAGAAGYYAFNDVHAVLAMLGAGELHRAEAWVARCAERAMTPEDARRTNHQMAREVGLPLMRGLLAWQRGAAAAACEQIYPIRTLAQRFGGSHAQRDLIDLTLLAAAAGGGHRGMGRALVNERGMSKPVTPLTRHWLQALGDSGGERA
ncbi:MAG: tetratricopeptide repeat protein [Rubrivivax sp.]